MAALSISKAWDETKARVAADGRLMAIVAAALIVLPGLIVEVISPSSIRSESTMVESILFLVSSLLALIGQLAIIRLAVTPAVSVGEAIGHGARRMPIYLVAALLLTIAFVLLLIPFGLVAYAAGVPFDKSSEQAFLQSPVALVLSLLYLALLTFIAIRMLMSSPVASEEGAGPVQILRRSWDLTAGHWWRLFGFIVMFVIGALILIAAVNWVVTAVAVFLFGAVAPMSASALLVGLCDAIVNGFLTVLLAVMMARIYLQLSGREVASVSAPRSGI
jgi:MFS family permease